MKKYYMLLAGTMLLAVVQTKAQTKIGGAGAPDGSAMLEVTGGAANNKGLLMPRLTTAQRNAITSPATGLMIYNTTTNQAQVNTGTPVAPIWAIATTTTTGWNTTGNTGTTPATNFIGTADSQAVVIRTNNTEKVRVTPSGNVGIGTATPGVKLQVRDTGDVTMLIGTPVGNRGHIALGNMNHGLIRGLESSGGEGNDMALYTTAGNAVGASLYLVSDPSSVNDSLPLNQFVLKSTGNVGIGTDAPTAKLSVNGTTNNLSGTWGIFSDSRVKTIDADYKDGLSTIMKIHPVKFHYNANAPFKSDEQQIGIIAQEMEAIAPYMVTKIKADGFDDLRQYNNQALPYMLVNAIQEQQKQIEALQVENKKLKNTETVTAQLMERIKQMEQMMGIKEIEGTSKIAGK